MTVGVEGYTGQLVLRLHAREWVGGQQLALVLGLVEGDRRDEDPTPDGSWRVWRNWAGPMFVGSVGWVLVEVTAARRHYPCGYERSGDYCDDHPAAVGEAAAGS